MKSSGEELEFEKRKKERIEGEREDRPSVLSRIEINYRRAIAGSSDSTNIFVAHSITTIHDEVRYIAVEKFLPMNEANLLNG